jgi:hypothetical protein
VYSAEERDLNIYDREELKNLQRYLKALSSIDNLDEIYGKTEECLTLHCTCLTALLSFISDYTGCSGKQLISQHAILRVWMLLYEQ